MTDGATGVSAVDYQTMFNLAVMIGAFLGGWVFNNISKAIDRLDKDVRGMPEKYMTKDDYWRDVSEMKLTLEKIWNKLDGKADK